MENFNSDLSTISDDDVALTDEEVAAAIASALKEKVKRLHHEAVKRDYAEKMRKASEPMKVSAEALYNWVLQLAETKVDGFKLDDHNTQLIATLCLYFTGDERFEAVDGRSLKKGIILAGTQPGQGKTTLMRLFAHNPRCSFAVINCHEIAVAYKRSGEEVLDQYSGASGAMYNNPFRHTTGGFCFDDLGTESIAKHYGNECNVMENILLTRYSNLFNESTPIMFRTTHLTTNLNAEQIEQMYGSRIRSRMREMFNLIDVPVETPDRRK